MKSFEEKIIAQPALNHGQLEELEKRLLDASEESRIHCARALAIARALSIPPAEIGKAANKLKIKISKCQLGCF